MKRTKTLSALLFAGALLAGCSTNGSSINPSVTQANLNSNTLQFAVGTANIGRKSGTVAVGLNTVVTFRQPNGNSATLVNTPTITGPAGFVVPDTSALTSPSTAYPMVGYGDGGSGTDAGTNHISGTPQDASQRGVATTFGQSGGAFSYGFAPFNSTTSGAANYPGHPQLYYQPFFSSLALRYYGGPPAYPFFNDGTFPTGFAGYAQGFTMFNAAAVAGAYTLSVLVPAANAAQATFTATGTLNDLNPLLPLPQPTFVDTAGGGATGVVTVPPDGRIIETLVYIRDIDSNTGASTYYTVGPIKGTGAQTYTIPNNLGRCGSPGCQTSKPSASFNAGDTVLVYAASFDYPAFEDGPPGNTVPNPPIVAANGQADITTSARALFTY